MTDELTRCVPTPVGQVYVTGVVLGTASSRTRAHSHDPASPPKPYQRCSACRWTQISIMRSTDRYTVVSEGMSAVPQEVPYGRVVESTDPEELIQGLYRVDSRDGRESRPFLPQVARLALAAAAEQDGLIARAIRGL